MRFKTFLESQWAHSKLDYASMVEWIENNAIKFFQREQLIFRGIGEKHNVEGLYNANQLNRRAAYADANYYNLWMSNHHTWNGYPRRDKSFICSTNEEKAKEYGNSYIVIPSDSSPIGVCPTYDIWDSFGDSHIALGLDAEEGNLSAIVDCVQSIFNRVLKHSVPDDDWEIFKKFCESITLQDIIDKCKKEFFYSHLVAYMTENKLNTLDDFLEYMLEPRTNGFTLQTASNFTAHHDKEIWMGGAILLLTEETYNQLKRDFL